MKELTADRLREILAYDPETGVFTWKVRTANCVRVGDVAGSFDDKGYIKIKIDGRMHKAHRLAWLYVHGVWPKSGIDHVNSVRDDNRSANLREATQAENMQNERVSRSNNKTGFLGVAPSYGKFQAQIWVGGKKMHIGTFDTPEEAHAAYLAAKREFHPFGTI